MTYRKRRGAFGPRRLWLLAALLLGVVLLAGCISGLQPIGWSGGAVADGTLYVGSKEGRLVSVNLADESRRWTEALQQPRKGTGFGCAPTGGLGCSQGPSGVAIYGTPVLSGELVYMAGYNGKVYAYNADTLALRWVYPREDYLTPIAGGLATDGTGLYFGGSDGTAYALEAATGDLRWEFATGDKIWSTPVVSGSTVYIGSFDHNLYAINAADGRKLWEFTTEGAIMSTPQVAGGAIYFGSLDRYFYAVDAATGALKWRFQAENWFWARPLLSEGNVYAGSLDGKVYVLNADTGTLVTDYELDGAVSSPPVAVDAGTLIVASKTGTVYTIDTGRGELRTLGSVDAEVYGPVTVSGGVVYIHTQDLTLHRINITTGAVLRPISLESSN